MSKFTSDRERRLWLWTLAVVAAIYSTLGQAAMLVGALRDRGLIDTVFVYEALRERASQERRVTVPALLAVLATVLVGVLDECIQAFLPSRMLDPLDMPFNVLASVMAVAASVVLAWARRLVSRLKKN